MPSLVLATGAQLHVAAGDPLRCCCCHLIDLRAARAAFVPQWKPYRAHQAAMSPTSVSAPRMLGFMMLQIVARFPDTTCLCMRTSFYTRLRAHRLLQAPKRYAGM